ncbi:MAG TPA: MarR family transcriptional regulator [Rhodanobacteraceae bacterium]
MRQCTKKLREPIDLVRFVPYQLSVISTSLNAAIAREYETPFGLTNAAWRVMAILGWRSGTPLSASDIAGLAVMDKVAISRALARLRTAGLVARRGQRTDRRRFVVTLTQRGLRVYQKIVPAARRRENEFLTQLTDEERTFLQHIFEKLLPRYVETP